ncbi:TPA: CopG family transcriptional regulator [Pseudomonas aeruginosa]|uniref:plasmid mobilization protein n=1 Tax=Pseudomonas aeruginosa TaxID=287 RepID=UPI001571B61F|nr:CopG family transcriptional regulator [Pseudomonas aeruginosa]MBG4356982.1 CopG family transcriptional regulator [Pseudomonas aeruginosa]MBP8497604.1 CopG family transcriptional regulator [Pseudomonas aeruginosa]MBP8514429.1 CopG family transcriptional regulator [Pseudomonas aeruginosa]NTS87073.1 CopG family transcriptional regulator [Pseudomonas aeruginosa]HCE6625614.1 CopG family transcriptional regulator [Pseudomonas aeruginosa]
MKDDKAPKGEADRPRRQVPPIKVWVTDDEKAELTRRADSSGLSCAAFLRAVGLNQPIGSRADLEAVRELVKLNGDFGRVAGLLKLWLVEKRGQGAKPIDVERMMIDFRELQAGIREKMSAIVFTRK